MPVHLDFSRRFHLIRYHPVTPKVFFFCVNEPADGCGGETPLTKNDELISKLDPEVLQTFEQKQIRYVRYLHNKTLGDHLKWMTWQQTFRTEDKEVL